MNDGYDFFRFSAGYLFPAHYHQYLQKAQSYSSQSNAFDVFIITSASYQAFCFSESGGL